jgi:tetratricopeptide (TPR) repeat protein
LSRLFHGELDWIVMKALEKDRNRRYETANGFALDVQRYLADEPVQACPPSAWYRFRKFARRNKRTLAVAGLILFFIALLGGGGGWFIRDREAREEAVAKERLDRGKQTTERAERMLDEVDQLEGEQKWPEALAAAKRAEAALAGGEADDAVLQRVRELSHDLAFVDRLERIREDSAIAVASEFYRGTARNYAQAFYDYGLDIETLSVDEAVARLRAKPALTAPVAAALDGWMESLKGMKVEASRCEHLVAVARGIDRDPLRDHLRAGIGRPVTPEFQAEVQRMAETIDLKAHSPWTIQALALTLNRSQLRDAALKILQDGVHAHPGDFWLNSALGYRFRERKNFEGAVRSYSAAVAIRPDSSSAYINLGDALGEHKKVDEAIACYKKAIRLEAKSIQAHVNFGIILAKQKKLDEAIECFKTAIEIDPKYAKSYSNLGAAREAQGELEEAVACYHKAIELDPKYAMACYNLATALYRQRKPNEAIAWYQKGLQLDPKNANGPYNIGVVLSEQGKPNEAIEWYQKAISIDLIHAPGHFNLGRALEKQGKLNEAICWYRKAIELDPNDAKAYYNLGTDLLIQRKPDEAVFFLRKAVELDPKNAWHHHNLGAALVDLGKLDEAVACYHKAIELDAKSANAHNNLGAALQAKGQFEEAIAEFRGALRIKKDEALYQNNLYNAEQLAALAKRLPAVRKGDDHPRMPRSA